MGRGPRLARSHRWSMDRATAGEASTAAAGALVDALARSGSGAAASAVLGAIAGLLDADHASYEEVGGRGLVWPPGAPRDAEAGPAIERLLAGSAAAAPPGPSARGWIGGFRVTAGEAMLGAVILRGPGEGDDARRRFHPEAFAPALALAIALDRGEGARAKGNGSTRFLVERAVAVCSAAGEPAPVGAAALLARFPEIVGRSRALLGLLHAAAVAAESDIPILIEGESGTGKELIALAIHRASRRRDAPFLTENCGALAENLAESELFGHEKGAFTGAERSRPGLFERARGGTVFLDEIGEMDLHLQKKLLRVLQEKRVRRLGAEDSIPLDFRIISATNRILEEMVASGAFREDLFYRLNVSVISVPPLRERREDIPLLVEHFNRAFAADMGRLPLEITPEALERLATHFWPGNIRELRNELWRLACAPARVVKPMTLSRRILEGSRPVPSSSDGAPQTEAEAPLASLERETMGRAILDALREAGGNRAEAARRLGITRSSLYRKLERYGIGG